MKDGIPHVGFSTNMQGVGEGIDVSKWMRQRRRFRLRAFRI